MRELASVLNKTAVDTFPKCVADRRRISFVCISCHPRPSLTASPRSAKGERRVLAGGVPSHHSPNRTTLRATAVQRCYRCTLPSPMYRDWRRPRRRRIDCLQQPATISPNSRRQRLTSHCCLRQMVVLDVGIIAVETTLPAPGPVASLGTRPPGCSGRDGGSRRRVPAG
jgi:hypothetical protein